MARLTLPKSLLDMPKEDRDAIVAVLLEASHLPKEKTLPGRMEGDEHNIWMRNGDELLADAEDELFRELWIEEHGRIIDLAYYLGLPIDEMDLDKSLEPEFHAFEDTLIKAKGSGRTKMSDYLKQFAEKAKKKTSDFGKWLTDGKALQKHQLKAIEELLSSKLPDYAKKAEAYAIRAGFIGKIRGEAEKKNFETLGAILDRVPEAITLAEKKDVVLTLREKQKAEAQGRKVTIMPLTPREAEAVKHASHHAGDKITEISARHMAGVRQLVMQAKKERWSASKLAQALFDKFGDHNRDWRRVAITELAFAANDAYLSGCSEGDQLIGMGAVGACKHCEKNIIGKVVTVRRKPPEKPTYKTDMEEVWVGKTNYGNRVAEYVAAIPLHPHCRCRWHRISRFYKLGKDGKLVLKDTAELINEERAKRGLAPDKSLEGITGEDRLRKMTEAFLKNNA
jgi:hypothetical protein